MPRFASLLLVLCAAAAAHAGAFVTARGSQLYRDGRPYRFVGTNYWYGSLIALERDPKRGIHRLRRELDFLKSNGVTNVRLMAGAEGSGMLNGVVRVGPPLQPEQGKFDERVLDGLDRVLDELSKRQMTAVIFFSNNWEWSGGFQQYLIWNGIEPLRFLTEKPTWDEYRDLVSQFYSCGPCKAAYFRQVELVIGRRNKFNGKRYVDDPAIMAWELANEPRPMRPAANAAYRDWIAETARFIRSRDKRHLITIGHEGWIGTQDVKLFEAIHADTNIDYMTIHIWPKNWGWFTGDKLAEGFANVLAETHKYIAENLEVARRLDKPMVIEEFGLPRDGVKFDASTPTTLRDKYYAFVLSNIGGRAGGSSYVAGANFWAFAGGVRPIRGQLFWKPGDEYLGDPPMEEQGLNSVFDSDRSTWKIVRSVSRSIHSGRPRKQIGPSRKRKTAN